MTFQIVGCRFFGLFLNSIVHEKSLNFPETLFRSLWDFLVQPFQLLNLFYLFCSRTSTSIERGFSGTWKRRWIILITLLSEPHQTEFWHRLMNLNKSLGFGKPSKALELEEWRAQTEQFFSMSLHCRCWSSWNRIIILN